MNRPPLQSFQVENFKAIRDSGKVEFGWLTAFIGNNGVGKSSLIEAVETFRDVAKHGVDFAFARWRGFEHALNKAPQRKLVRSNGKRVQFNHPMKFHCEWKPEDATINFSQEIVLGDGGNSIFIRREELSVLAEDSGRRWSRDENGEVVTGQTLASVKSPLPGRDRLGDGDSMLEPIYPHSRLDWQFLMLNPDQMGQPALQQRATKKVNLAKDGSNVAQYLNDIREIDPNAFDGILDAVRSVLPYAADLQPTLTSELERAFYLKLKEESYEVPGWLLSTGTLRIVALLACLRHPQPPRLLVIEEIENGLDPRTLHLVVEEIRAAITAGTTQVILTTHSPYLLDLLDLSHIVVVEREAEQPVFRRPNADELADWSRSFSPGRLYTMGRLTKDDP